MRDDVSAMEYRYDSARQRYRTQPRDPREYLANGVLNTQFLWPYDSTTQAHPGE